MIGKAIFLAILLIVIWGVVDKSGLINGQKKCTLQQHDKNIWHQFKDEKTGCIYDHEHGVDPKIASDMFGEVGGWFGQPGREISYPWQTFSVGANVSKQEVLQINGVAGKGENDLKHGGYKWAVQKNLPCVENYCVTDFRIQYHMHTSDQDAPVRWHSAAAEVRVCKRADLPETCGIVRTGGWFDFGRLIVADTGSECWEQINKMPNSTEVINLEKDNQFVLPLDSTDLGLMDEFRCYQKDVIEWWGHGGSDFRFIVKVADADAQISTDGHGGIHLMDTGKQMLDREVKIGYTLPINQIYTGRIGTDGKVNLPLGKNYINRFGELVSGCEKAGLDCIPIEYSNIWVDPNERENFGFKQF